MSNGNGNENRTPRTFFEKSCIVLGIFFLVATLLYLLSGHTQAACGEALLVVMEIAFYLSSRDRTTTGGGSLSLDLAGFAAGILGNIIVITSH